MAGTRFRQQLASLALRAWPAALRLRHGRALRQTFLAAWHAEETTSPGLRRAWRRFLLATDLTRQGLGERLLGRRRASALRLLEPHRETLVFTVVWDLRSAVRALGARPLFAAMVVLTLGLGLGSTTAIFSVVEAVLLRPLPYPDDERLVLLGERDPSRNLTGTSWPAFDQWRAFPELESVGAWEESPLLFGTGEQVERVAGAAVSPAFFSTLGVAAAHGRALLPGDPPFKPDQEIVLGHDLWQRQFGADPAVVGRAITLEGKPHTVVGVMPPHFAFPTGTEFWRATLAFVLAACGVYGITTYWVAERWRELGLRVALGASPDGIARWLAGRVLGLAALGIATGLAATWLAGGLFRHLLFGIEPGDPATLAGAGVLLACGAALAVWLPARRASRIDPAETLRAE
ncbi:MAG TPA: ABC transporter permease [Vicinamibacterales bacterium]|nr:ABC transporter permease [Vicinamibacterales bacterium]